MISEEIILQTENARVRIIELSPDAVVAWHYHSEVNDDIICLEGCLEVHIKNPQLVTTLKPGDRCIIEKQRVHRVVNCTSQQSRYLLVQGVGKYDFIEEI